MKAIALTAVAALFLGALPTLAQQESAAPAAAAGKVKKQKKASERLMGLLKKGVAIQKGIKDKESAEAAVPKLKKLAEKMEKLNEPLQEELQNAGPDAGMTFMMQMMGIAASAQEDAERLKKADFYGCEELRELMEKKPEQESTIHIDLTPDTQG